MIKNDTFVSERLIHNTVYEWINGIIDNGEVSKNIKDELVFWPEDF